MTLLPRRRTMTLSILLLVGCGGDSEITDPQPPPPTIRPPSPLRVERDALVALYNAMGGDSWKHRDNWLTSAPVEDWYGVDVHGSTGRVHSIDLRDNGLSGSIPPEIGAFESIVHLALSDNSIGGSIPPELAELSRLENLWLTGCGLTGPIPPGIENLEDLVSLDLTNNLLAGSIPPGIGSLAGLARLNLNDNLLTGSIPPEIGNLDGLVSLNLQGNLLTGPIPPELGELSRLEYLRLEDNGLTGSIPPEIGDLVSLEVLILTANDLAGAIPEEIGGATRLEELQVNGNAGLRGLMPRSLLQLRNLVALRAYGTELCAALDTGFRAWMRGIPFLEVEECDAGVVERMALAALFNTTGGEVWENAEGWNTDGDLESWYGVTVEDGRVRGLLLADNSLEGSFPTAIVTLTELEHLDLSDNDLTGGLPGDVGYMSSLKTLLVSGNTGLDGLVPSSMLRLTRMAVFRFEDTGLCMPATRGFQTWVAGLDLGGSFCTNLQDVALALPMAYLVQAIQNPGEPVPLVANRDALLRVFLTAPALHGFSPPPVLATFHREGEQVHQVRIEAPGSELPVEVDQGNLYESYNAVIPAEHIRPGLEFFVEADPDGSLILADDAEDRYPADTGSVQLTVVPVPAMDLTVVPVLNAAEPDSSIFSQVTGLTKDSHVVSMLRWAFPFSKFEVRTRDTYVTSLDLTTDEGTHGLIRELMAVRDSESGTGYWYGTALSRTGVVRGMAIIGGKVSVGKPLAVELAHEVGHNLNLWHAPCGDPDGIDPSFPYSDGGIGVWGYDFREGVVVNPAARDLMGYCPNVWLSDYSYRRVLTYRDNADTAGDASTQPPRFEQLVLSGGVFDGELTLEPPYRLTMPPRVPSLPGRYRIEGFSGADRRFSLRFAPDEDKFGNAYFFFAVPVQRGEVDRIVLAGPEGEVVVDQHDVRTITIIRDGSGSIRGMLRDWEGDIPAMPGLVGEIDLVSYRGLREVRY